MRSPGPEYSGSSTSTTTGGCGNPARARAATPAKARSTRRTFASECSRMNATLAASSRVLIGTRTAPVIGIAKWASIISGVFASRTATVVPRPIPRAASADASRRHRSRVPLQVYLRAPCTTATCSGYTSALQSRNTSGVSGAKFALRRPSPTSKSSMPTHPPTVGAGPPGNLDAEQPTGGGPRERSQARPAADRHRHRPGDVGEEVVALVVDDDERREVLDLDPPDRLHAELGVLEPLDVLDAVLGQPRRRATDRPQVEAAVPGA